MAIIIIYEVIGLPRWLSGEESACNAGDAKTLRFDPWVGKIPWNRKWQPTPVFLPGESHGGKSLVGYSPWGHKELDTTKLLHFNIGLYIYLPLCASWGQKTLSYSFL